MILRKVLTLSGPNYWAFFPVLEALVELGPLKDTPSDAVPGFNDRLIAWFPTMLEHRCSEGVRGGFFERLRLGTYPAHVLEHVTIELQSLAGTPVGYGRARAVDEEAGIYRVVVEYEEAALGLACLKAAREVLMAAYEGRDHDVAGEVARLKALASDVRLGPSTRAIVEAARARGIPTRRLGAGSLIQLGYGAKARRAWTAETDRTGAIAQAIAQDKELTRTLLQSVGVPVPAGRPAADADDAVATASALKGPVVVKPRDGNHGRGVATDLTTPEQVRAAYDAARAEGSEVIVERFAPGLDHRLLVVGDRLVAAARREPAQVVGDGRATIAELVGRVNADPRRGEGHEFVLTQIRLDDPIARAVVAEQGYTAESVPPAGAVVLIRRNANLSTGGTAIDVTDRVHPAVAARAVEAARVVGLDVAGVDVVALDIDRPLEDQGGVVVEVNAGPGLRMHLEPSEGTPRPVGEAVVGLLFPEGDDGRIPVVGVTGVNGKTTTTRLIAALFEAAGRTVGMTSTDGIYVGGRRIEAGDCAGPGSARAVLMNPAVEAAVLETARGGILREGLAYDVCDVAVVTNIGEGDHLGMSEITTPEQLARVKRCVVEVVRPGGTAVLNAADPLVAAMSEKCRGSVLYFARDPEDPVVTAHRAAGGRAAIVRDGRIVLAEGPRETPLIDLEDVPLTLGGRVPFQVENALAAAGAGWAAGLDVASLRRALSRFAADAERAPGRFNVLEGGGATVILDYGHNASALEALGEAMEAFPTGRRIAMYTVAGDRRDADIVRQGELLGELFDVVVIYEDACNRGRAEGEILALMRRGLAEGSRVEEVHETRGERAAVERALGLIRPGDLVLIQPDDVDRTVAFVRDRVASLAAPRAARPTGDARRTPARVAAPIGD